MKAIREYDEGKGVPFSAFAKICVMRKIFPRCGLPPQ